MQCAILKHVVLSVLHVGLPWFSTNLISAYLFLFTLVSPLNLQLSTQLTPKKNEFSKRSEIPPKMGMKVQTNPCRTIKND